MVSVSEVYGLIVLNWIEMMAMMVGKRLRRMMCGRLQFVFAGEVVLPLTGQCSVSRKCELRVPGATPL